ncbi:PaaI family thioesterase [Cumulibacter soli]|uniref:PaaI family thioesterase n=1 Tax=Cumulibacter soli TaxID=2546344 RepID=UPI001FBA4C57|nr:PaaI family thioesterase [Cumulibacter soli]
MSADTTSGVDFSTMSGLETLRWIKDRGPEDGPGINRLIGMQFDEVEFGRVVMSLTTQPNFGNPLGTVHGGIAATLLDSVVGCAVHSTMDAGVSYTTLELKVNYIRAARTDGQKLIGEGDTIHVGRRTATAEGRVLDEHGNLIAHATTTCIVLR